MKKGDATRAQIVAAAAELLDSQGYHGTGINAVLVKAGAPRGSLYFHFPGGKDEIATAAISQTAELIEHALVAAFARYKRSEHAVREVFQLFEARLVESNYACGCPISTVSLELSGSDSPVLAACARAYESWTREIAKALEPSLGRSAMDRASLILSLVEGALLLSRATRSLKPLQTAERHCLELVKAD
ncbi:MAG: TetR/AcrR family transcriptional regulator [Polyangiaceae bacterium]|nr:TetR/AcrR family transcriptional regulator [Polyangiaceae bacterium]